MDVGAWLRRLGLGQYATAFAENDIDGETLAELTNEDLKELGVNSLGHRKKLVAAIAELGNADRVTDAPLQTATHEAEHRHLTVMFCDLVGSTGLAERLDDEALRDLLRRFQACCAEEIRRFEGHVAKYIGDGLLAYFGYPQAHEDDAARAVHAACGILEAIPRLNTEGPGGTGVELNLRIGIHTGPVVAGEMGGGETRERFAIVGETPNIAARLEALAESDTAVISEATHRLIDGLFDVVDLGPQTLKGVSKPVRAYRVVGESAAPSRFEASAERGLAPLIGRREELELLRRRWELSKDGESQVVLLSGEAGIGKSRLVRGLRATLEDESFSQILWFGSPYHENSAFHVAIDQFRRALRFTQGDTDAAKLDKLEAVLLDLGMPVDRHAPILARFLSLPTGERYGPIELSPLEFKQKLLASSVAVFKAMAAKQPVLIAVEDAHWIDPSTLELLSFAIEQTERCPILFLITFRPEFKPLWEGRGNVVSLRLGGLSLKESALLAANTTLDGELPPDIAEQIVTRTDGVPLFVEELTKVLLESGLLGPTRDVARTSDQTPRAAIPESLHDSLIARLDRLDSAKEVAQLASVIGRTFNRELLAAILTLEARQLDDTLERLIDAEIIYPRGMPPNLQFEFKHALVRDAAYQSLLKTRRCQFHRQIAEALIENFPDLADAQPEVLAQHFTEAGVAEKAVPLWLASAQRANERSANREAVEHCRQGLALIADLPASADRDRRELAFDLILGPSLIATSGFGSTEVGETYDRARELAECVGDFGQSYAANWGIWLTLQHTGKTDAANDKADELLTMAEKHDDDGLLLQAHHSCWTSRFAREELQPVLDHTAQGIKLYDIERHRSHAYIYGGHDPGVCCRVMRAITLCVLGRLDEANVMADESIALAKQLEHPFSLAIAVSFAGSIAMYQRKTQQVRARADELEQICYDYGFAQFAAMAPVLRGWSTAACGDPEEGVKEIGAAIEALRDTGTMRLSFPLALLGEAQSWAGRKDAGLTAMNEAIEVVEKSGERRWESEIHRLKGELLLLNGSGEKQQAEAETCLRKALAIADNQGALLFQLRAATSLARLLDRQGKRNDARDILVPVYRRFTEGFETRDLTDAKSLVDRLS